MRIPKRWLQWCFDQYDDDEEFDSGMIQEMLELNFGVTFKMKVVGKALQYSLLSRRNLSEAERKRWQKRYGSKPRTVYTKHLGRNPERYGWGYARPTRRVIQEVPRDFDECASCPEWDECQGEIMPCPRYPDLKDAPKNKVMKLEEFDE